MHSSQVFAALAAFSFASSHVLNKRALQRAGVVGGVLVGFLGALIVLALATAVTAPHSLTTGAVLAFAGIGIVSSGVGTWASTVGIDRLGPSNSVPVQSGIRPIVSAALAVTLLGEAISMR